MTPEHYARLVHDRGWPAERYEPPERYEHWLGEAIVALCGPRH